jgi:putative proteasome-type protease
MTYCIGINVNEGMIFASDSRTNAGLDNVNTYSKMLNYAVGDRNIVIVTSGNLATSQAVYSSVKKDLESKNPHN